MRLSTNIKLEQKQNLIMTHELKESINLLAYNNLELVDYINKQVEENPILEIDRTDSTMEETNYPTTSSWDFNLDILSSGREVSLLDHLLEQIGYLNLTKKLKAACIYIAGNIDERGYLDLEQEEFIKKTGLTSEDFLKSLELVQTLEPAGIGARNICESFKIQLKRKGSLDRKYIEFIDYYFLEILDLGKEEISQKLEISMEKLEEMIDELSNLTPYPARNFKKDRQTNYTIADIIISRRDGDFKIDFYDNFIPKIYINPYYKKILSKSKNPQEVEYIKEKIKAANWLMRSIESRRLTIIKVVKSILKYQYDFFYKNIDYLLPLRLKDIAQDIDMHESTVSRVVKNKYLQTDIGVYPLSHFFNSALKTKNGLISSYDTKNIIKLIIDKEDKKRPYSDQDIKEILYRDMDIKISRRTVAKYRVELSLASSYERKRLRRLEKT